MNELKLYNFTENADKDMTSALIRMFYHAAFNNKIGIAENGDDLLLVGVENVDEDSGEAEYYPLARILRTEEAVEISPANE